MLHHKCHYTQESLEAAAKLSDRYIAGRFLPDKAIDLIDEAGAKMRIEMMSQPQDIGNFEVEIEETRLASYGEQKLDLVLQKILSMMKPSKLKS